MSAEATMASINASSAPDAEMQRHTGEEITGSDGNTGIICLPAGAFLRMTGIFQLSRVSAQRSFSPPERRTQLLQAFLSAQQSPAAESASGQVKVLFLEKVSMHVFCYFSSIMHLSGEILI